MSKSIRLIFCNPGKEFLRMSREERPAFARFLDAIINDRPAPALEDCRACLRHYANEIFEFVEMWGFAPPQMDAYTCGADYQHEAGINPRMFQVAIDRINEIVAGGVRGDELRNAIDLAITNL